MSDWLTQAAWAKRCGVTTRTFLRWRGKGRIPLPDVDMSGPPRWTVTLVEQTMRGLRRKNRGFQSRSARFQQDKGTPNRAGLASQVVGQVHTASVRDAGSSENCNSIVGTR